MIIANPIYDTVFKFLLEGTSVAKLLFSAIIGEEIEELHPKPQEQTTVSTRHLLTVFRVDFKAVIRTAKGERKKVLIENQKSNVAFDIIRFRHYLGSNYSQKDEMDGLPPETRTPLEKLLSVLNQRYVFDPAQKWLLSYPGGLSDEALRPILSRLSKSAES